MAKKTIFYVKLQPPVGQKSESPPKNFSPLFILGLALSIAKVSTRSGIPPLLVRKLTFVYSKAKNGNISGSYRGYG